MIPTTTLRERIIQALANEMNIGASLEERGTFTIERLAAAVIDAIGDPVLIKTADSLEPTFTLRAQDKLADAYIDQWAEYAEHYGASREKCDEARRIADAFRVWPTRKWPN